MMTLKLPKKQVNAILVALDTEIDYMFETGGKPDWETFPEVAAMLMAYYTTRCEFDKDDVLAKPQEYMTTPQRCMAEAREIQQRLGLADD